MALQKGVPIVFKSVVQEHWRRVAAKSTRTRVRALERARMARASHYQPSLRSTGVAFSQLESKLLASKSLNQPDSLIDFRTTR